MANKTLFETLAVGMRATNKDTISTIPKGKGNVGEKNDLVSFIPAFIASSKEPEPIGCLLQLVQVQKTDGTYIATLSPIEDFTKAMKPERKNGFRLFATYWRTWAERLPVPQEPAAFAKRLHEKTAIGYYLYGDGTKAPYVRIETGDDGKVTDIVVMSIKGNIIRYRFRTTDYVSAYLNGKTYKTADECTKDAIKTASEVDATIAVRSSRYRSQNTII